jgi:copper chaperone CopZ
MNTVNSDNITTVTAPDIVCEGCANAIRKALGNVDGIDRVEVNIQKKEVSVAHTVAVTRGRIIEVLEDAGFSAA